MFRLKDTYKMRYAKTLYANNGLKQFCKDLTLSGRGKKAKQIG